MTLEEAIIHCKEKACGNTQCAFEHRQLAEWLQELQQYRKNTRNALTREEAIRRVKAWQLDADDMEVLSVLIPELRESEDERIRSCIECALTDVNEQRFTDFGVTLKDCLAYLEKQKEQKLTINIEHLRSYLLQYLQDAANRQNDSEIHADTDKWAKKIIELIGVEEQKEQIPYIDFVIKPHKGDDNNPYDMSVSEAQEYTMNRGFDIPWNDGDVYVDERHLTQTIGNIIRWADEHPKEQKPAEYTPNSALQKIKRTITDCKKLSEHYKKMSEHCKDTEKNFYHYYGGKADGLQLALAYFENGNEQPLKEYAPDSVQFDEGFKTGREVGFREGVESVKQSAEWSEEDEKALNGLIYLIEEIKRQPLKRLEDWDGYIRFLKSLRPQSHRKPSEDQKYDENMDKECIKLCDILNSIPSINTFESCCGHLKDRYSIWFLCNDIITISRLGRCVERNYSDGKWELLVDSTDTHPTGVYWLRSKVPFQSYDEMEKSVNELCSNILHWFNAEFDSYFERD